VVSIYFRNLNLAVTESFLIFVSVRLVAGPSLSLLMGTLTIDELLYSDFWIVVVCGRRTTVSDLDVANHSYF
jgi:hypothetical protein